MSTPRLSVVVATHNRRDSLRRCLEALADQDFDPEQLEVLVAANGSRDGTEEMVSAFLATRPGWQLISLPQPGKTAALVVAYESAQAPIIAATDDDTLPRPGWANWVLDGFARHPRAAAVGGGVIPHWPGGGEAPSWLGPGLLPLAGWSEPVARDLVLPSGQWLLGANWAVDREWYRRVGGYRPELVGPVGERHFGNEENELMDRLRAAGGEIWKLPGEEMPHVMGPERETPGYYRRRSRDQGISDAQLLELRSPTPRRQAAATWLRWRLRSIREGRALGSDQAPAPDAESFARECWRWQVLGFSLERARQGRRTLLGF